MRTSEFSEKKEERKKVNYQLKRENGREEMLHLKGKASLAVQRDRKRERERERGCLGGVVLVFWFLWGRGREEGAPVLKGSFWEWSKVSFSVY